jgi:hypothetical protein
MADESRTSLQSDQLTQIVRECVRSEMELQRSGRQGNTNLLSRTRDLIAGSARSASREAANSFNIPSQAALVGSTSSTQSTFSRSPGTSASVPILMSPDASSTSYPAGRPTTLLTSSKRAATSQHPWRLKKGKQKKTVKQQFYPKAVHLLDKPLEEYIGLDDYISDYPIKDDMVLLKCFVEIGTGQKEEEIRQSITEVYKCSCMKTILLLFVTIIDKVTI